MPSTWAILGANRTLGFSFVRTLLLRGDLVLACVRDANTASSLWQLAANTPHPGQCQILQVDVQSASSVAGFATHLRSVLRLDRLDYLVVCVGALGYPGAALEAGYGEMMRGVEVNAVGPVLVVQRVLKAGVGLGTVVFFSSEQGTAAGFREAEDGFAVFAAAKAALNMLVRHLAAELRRKSSPTIILTFYPGELSSENTDDPDSSIEGLVTPAESVAGMMALIPTKTLADSGTFWTWEGKECPW